MTCLGCLYIETAPVTLRDGRTVCTSCPDWRLETEAKFVLTLPKIMRTKYLADVTKERGEEAGEALRAEVLALWDLRATVAK